MPGAGVDAIEAALGGFAPSDEQWQAIAHPPEPVAVVAGAGTGKTAIMAARIVFMVQEMGLRPPQILGLTFTNRAARELEERIHKALALLDPPPAELPEIATYNSFADGLVRTHGVRVGIDPEVGLLSEAQRWQLATEALADVPPFEFADWVSVNHFCRIALGLADACANHDVTPQAVIAEDERVAREVGPQEPKILEASNKRMELMRLVSAYVSAKAEHRWIDFGDQMTKAVEILQSSPALVEELRDRYPMILLDEYQDTNIVQRKLMQYLAPEGHNITAVGDARQNIYEWRGSTIFNLIDFPQKHFLRDKGGTHEYLSLSENFRSGSRILKVANEVIDKIDKSRRPGKELRAFPRNGEGYVATGLYSDEFEEAEFIASEIERLHGTELPPAGEADWREFAILVRRRSLIPRIYAALRAKSIPVEVVGLGGLLETPEVIDTVAWLRVLADPGPEANRWLARILMGPRFRIHYRDLAVLARWAAAHTRKMAEAKREAHEAAPGEVRQEGLREPAPVGERASAVLDETQFEPDEVAFSLLDALDHLEEIEGLGPEAVGRLNRARSDVARLRRLDPNSLLELAQAVAEEAGIAEELRASPRQDASASLQNLTKFMGMIGDFQPVSGDPSLPAFLEFLDAAEGAEESFELATPSEDDSVKLMTVHQAKGLEFGVVFVPGVAARENEKGEKVDSIFPSQYVTDPSRSYGALPFGVREDREHLPTPWITDEKGRRGPKKPGVYRQELLERALEEERRLFYVALTRARQRLYVTAAYYYDRHTRARGPSLFFEEVAEIEGVDGLAVTEPPAESPVLDRLALEAVWPPSPEHRLSLEEPFPEGYPALVEELLAGKVSETEVLSRLEGAARSEAEKALEAHRRVISGIAAAASAAVDGISLESLSATELANLASGRVGVDDILRPLPEPPSAARRMGTEVHQWIEEQSRGLMGLADEEELEEPSGYAEPSRIAATKSHFQEKWSGRVHARLPGTEEPMAELPFVLKVGERLVRGRIDAVYEDSESGGLEIVDFKTGRKVEAEAPDQLDVYAAALTQLGVEFRGPLRLTYAYLSTGETESRQLTAEEATATLERLERELEAILNQADRGL